MAGSIKKPINIEILRILQAHTDAQHPMRLKAISEKLQEVGLTPTRKSITNNIVDLQAAGYPLVYNHGWFYQKSGKKTPSDACLDRSAGLMNSL